MVQVQVASRGLPLPRPTSLPLELYFQYFLCFFIYLRHGNIFIILITLMFFRVSDIFRVFQCFFLFLIFFSLTRH